MRRFLARVTLPEGTRYALLTTEMAPRATKATGRIPTEDELARTQRVRPLMNEILGSKGMIKVSEGTILVTDVKGPLEADWEQKVADYVSELPLVT